MSEAIGEEMLAAELEIRAQAARGRHAGKASSASHASDAARGLGRRALDLAGGLACGAFIGWLIDRFAGTAPLGMVGIAALAGVVTLLGSARSGAADSR